MKDSNIILGMIMLEDEYGFDLGRFISGYNSNYNPEITEHPGDDTTATFNIDGELVALAHIPAPVPMSDLENVAQYAYNWPGAMDDIGRHKSHLIVSLTKGGQGQVKRYKIFTQVICSLLEVTNSIGVYKGNQSLLIDKDAYLSEASYMSDDYSPLNLWIYFGLSETNSGTAGYTYGLKEFNKTEMEITASSKSLEDIRDFLFNIAHYVLDNNVIFEDGQTIGLSEDEKIAITLSEGIFQEGDTFKLAY